MLGKRVVGVEGECFFWDEAGRETSDTVGDCIAEGIMVTEGLR